MRIAHRFLLFTLPRAVPPLPISRPAEPLSASASLRAPAFPPSAHPALFGDVPPALSRRALGGHPERACRRGIVRHLASPHPGGARSARSQRHVHGGAVPRPSDVGAGGSELSERRATSLVPGA